MTEQQDKQAEKEVKKTEETLDKIEKDIKATEKDVKEVAKEAKQDEKKDAQAQKKAESKEATTEPAKKSDDKKDSKTDKKKVAASVRKMPKKEYAEAFGRSMPVSLKHSMYIARFIKNKPIDQAITELEEVKRLKRAIPFKGEIPHRKGPGMMSGRYPVKAAGNIISVLKGLKGNALVNGLELDRTRITIASASWAARPMKRGGRAQGKRTNLTLRCAEIGGQKK